MRYLKSKLSALLLMLLCVSAAAQAELVHRDACEPTLSQRGFTLECWEDTETGKVYSIPSIHSQNELRAWKVIKYMKLPTSPIVSYQGGMEPRDYEQMDVDGCTYNWAVAASLNHKYRSLSIEFAVKGENAANARIVLGGSAAKTHGEVCNIIISVNGTKTSEESVKLENTIYVKNLPNVTTGD